MAEQVKPERKKLTITQAQEPKPVGDKGAIKLAFKAKDTEGKELAYFTFTKSIFEFIKPEVVIDGDVETSTREYEGNTYTDRKVTMIYQDGKPVAESKGGWSSGKGGGYSIEAEKIKQESMAASYVKDIWLAGKISDTDSLVTALRHWLGEKLGVKPETQQKGQPAPEKTSESQPAKPCALTLDWVTKQLNTLNKAGVKTGDPNVFLDTINKQFGRDFQSIVQMLKELDASQKGLIYNGLSDKVKSLAKQEIFSEENSPQA